MKLKWGAIKCAMEMRWGEKCKETGNDKRHSDSVFFEKWISAKFKGFIL